MHRLLFYISSSQKNEKEGSEREHGAWESVEAGATGMCSYALLECGKEKSMHGGLAVAVLSSVFKKIQSEQKTRGLRIVEELRALV